MVVGRRSGFLLGRPIFRDHWNLDVVGCFEARARIAESRLVRGLPIENAWHHGFSLEGHFWFLVQCGGGGK